MSRIDLQNAMYELSSTSTELIPETKWYSIYSEMLQQDVDIDISYSSGPYKGTSLIWWLAYHGKWDYITEIVQLRVNYSEIFNTKPQYHLLHTTSRGTFYNGVSLLSLALLAKQRNFVEFVVFTCECVSNTIFLYDNKECNNLSLAASNGYIEVFLEILGLESSFNKRQRLLIIDFANIVHVVFESKRFIILNNILKERIAVSSSQDGMHYVANYVRALIAFAEDHKAESDFLQCIINIVGEFEKLCGYTLPHDVIDIYKRTIHFLAQQSEVDTQTLILFFEHYLYSKAFSIKDLQYFYVSDARGILHIIPSKVILIHRIIQSDKWKKFDKYLQKERDAISSLSHDIKNPIIKAAIQNSQWDLLQLLDNRFLNLLHDQPDLFKCMSSLFLDLSNCDKRGSIEVIHKKILVCIHVLMEVDIDSNVLKKYIIPNLSLFLANKKLWRYLAEYLLLIPERKRLFILETLGKREEILEFSKYVQDFRNLAGPREYTFKREVCEFSKFAGYFEIKQLSTNIQDAREKVMSERRGGSNNALFLKHQEAVMVRMTSQNRGGIQASFTRILNILGNPGPDDLTGIKEEYLSALFSHIRDKIAKIDNEKFFDLMVFYRVKFVPCMIAEIDRTRQNPLLFLMSEQHYNGRCRKFFLEKIFRPGYIEFMEFILIFYVSLNSYWVFVDIVNSALDCFVNDPNNHVAGPINYSDIIQDCFKLCVEKFLEKRSSITLLCEEDFVKNHPCYESILDQASNRVMSMKERFIINFNARCISSFRSFFYVFFTCFLNDVNQVMLTNRSWLTLYQNMPSVLQARTASYFPDITQSIDKHGRFKEESKTQLIMLQKYVKQSCPDIVTSLPFVAEELYKKLVVITFSMLLKNLLNNANIPSYVKEEYKESYCFAWRDLYKVVSPQIEDFICERLRNGVFFQRGDRKQLYIKAQTYHFSSDISMEHAFTTLLEPAI